MSYPPGRTSADNRAALSEGIKLSGRLEKLLELEDTRLGLQDLVLAERGQNQDLSTTQQIQKYLDTKGRIKESARAKRTFSFSTTHAQTYLSGVPLLENEPPVGVLKKTLSVKSQMTVASAKTAFTNEEEKHRADALKGKLSPIICIGAGEHGRVYAVLGTDWAVKKSIQHAAALFNDWSIGLQMCHAVYNIAVPAMRESGYAFSGVSIPRVPTYSTTHCFGDKPANDSWWHRNGPRFSGDKIDTTAEPLYLMERILPVPAIVRQNLILALWPTGSEKLEAARNNALVNPDNGSCLIRPYLGLRRDQFDQAQRYKFDNERMETLRNFPLCLDEFRHLGIDPKAYARDMGVGLAAAHFAAGVTTNDIEFVIGSRRIRDTATSFTMKTKGKSPRNVSKMDNNFEEDDPQSRSFRNRGLQLWMFDFGACEEFPIPQKNEAQQIFEFVKRSRSGIEDFIPRYVVSDKLDFEVWVEFRTAYVKAGRAILKHKLDGHWAQILPVKLIRDGLKRPDRVIDEWQRQESAWSKKHHSAYYKDFEKLVKEGNWKDLYEVKNPQ
ncbi:Zinc finger protein [Colletotrichum sp. SAR 10_70]|nr:Zinc finger protein [Colletotrichum sp. SAR 10_71]KAI8190677.1 Zinc finger protein [Colletotrichum sp. SAR 10_70]